jgi:autotransporter-associated beta strand protein
LTGTGTIGTTTFKNTSVTVTQAGTSTFSGAINAANFTKAGTGALTLNSWTATSPATTNISNAYTVSSGSLTLTPSGTYPAINPASVNVVNNATFSLGTGGNGTWKNTAFNFTGGLGGGTMNLQGNPIGDINTTNTFSTSGGATNTINGGLNANNANVNFSLAAATSGTTLHDGTFAALVFPSNSQGGFGLSNATTLNINGSGGVLFKDKLSATQINVNAGTLQMGDGSAATSAATADLTASQVAIASNAKVIFQRAEAVTSSTVFSGSGALQQAGTGTLTLTGNSNAFAGTTTVHDSRNLAIGTGGSLGAAGSSLVLSNASANVAFTNTSGTSTIGSTISGSGSLSKSGAGTGVITADNSYSGATTVSGGTLQVGNAGSTGTLGSGNVTLSNNANLHVLRAADTTLSNTISGAGHVSASITGTGSDLNITGSVSLTGGTVNLAADGNLSVQQAIGTTNTTDSAIVLTAGKPTNAGTSSGGDVSMSGSGSLSTGAGGRATIYTGSLSGSTGLGITTGNNRYNSDESSTNYSAALGSGTYAIYREKPTITVLVNDASKTYDGLAFNGGSLNTTLSSGALVRSDSFSAVTASSTLGGAAQGEKNAGQYAITASDSGGKNALGYGVTYTSGQLTIHQADLTVTANSVSKTYDGTTSASGTGTVGTLAGAAAGDVVNSAGSQAFLTSGAGNNKTVRASGVTIKDSANADMTGNYNINYTDNNTGVIQKANLTLTANDDARFVGMTDTAGYTGVSPSGLVNGEDMSVLGGTLSITRTNASTLASGVYADVLSPSGLTSDNYNISYVKGTYTIVPANQLLIRNSNISSTYGSTWSYDPTAKYLDGSDNTIITLSRTGSGNSFTFDDGLGTTVSATLNPYSGTSVASTSNAGHTVVGSYKIKDASPTVVGSNFVGSPVFVGTLNVNTKALTPSTTGVSMVYNGSTAMSNLSMDVTGKVGTDAVTIQGTGTYSQKHVGTHLNYTVANLALSGNDAGNYHIQGGVSSITGNDGTITPATLKLSTSNVSKTYDGNTSASGTAIATQNTQLFGNDSLNGGTFVFSNKNASSGDKVVQVSGVMVNDGNSGQNYSVSYVDNTTSTITKKEVTLSSITAANKTYDGNTTATITSGSISGTVGSETLAISGSGTFDNKNAADGKTVTVSDVSTLTKADGTGSWSNYNLTTTSKTTTANITPKAITLSGITAANKTYDGNTSATVSTANAVFNNQVAGDTLTVTSTGSFADKNAGNSKTVSLSNTLGGADLGNYTVTEQTTATANIGQKSLTITGLSAVNKVYDGTTQASISSANVVFSGLISGDQVNLAATGTFDTRHVGDNKVVSLSSSLQGADAGNYNATASSDLRAHITPASLTVRAPTVVKTYDGTTAAPGTATVVGTLAGASAGDTFNSAALSFTDKNAGTHKTVTAHSALIKDGTDANVTGNYTITYLQDSQSQITPAAASISAPGTSVVYNGQTQSQGDALLSGFVPGDNVQAMGLASGRNAGSYQSSLSASGTDVGNYSITYNNAALTISKRSASLSALGQTVVYNGQTQSLNGTQGSGFLASDALNFGGLPSGRNVGQYTSALTVSGADAANYDVTLGSATLTIMPKGASITARPERVTYNGQTQQQSAALLEGFVAGDDIQVSGLASGRNAGVYSSNVQAFGQDVANYSISYQQGALTVDKAPLQFVGTKAADKMYDGNTDARVTAGTLSGLVGTETLNIDSVQGQFGSPEMGMAKPVQVVYGLSDGANGGLVSNYQWSPVTVQANITGSTTEHAPAPEPLRKVTPFSRLSFLGFGGLVRSGASTGQLFYPARNNDQRTCTPLQMEDCLCEQAPAGSMQVCYPAVEVQ